MTTRFQMFLSAVILAASAAVAWAAADVAGDGAAVTKGDRLSMAPLSAGSFTIETPTAEMTIITRLSR